jgi:site-specific recombinase XerD
MLVEAIVDYLEWEKTLKANGVHRSITRDSLLLIDFLRFIARKEMPWEEMFTLDTLKAFCDVSRFKQASRPLIALSGFLYSNGKIPRALTTPRKLIDLPDPFDPYLRQQSHRVSPNYLRLMKGILASFYDYLEKHSIALAKLKIEELDHFLAEQKVSRATRNLYRYCLRGFLRYLHRERRMMKKDLASLLVGPRCFAEQKPPKFLRPQEVQTLFASLPLSTPSDIRTYAIVLLAYTLGLRPVEIGNITLDDISFRKRELTLPNRKALNPITLPLPEQTLKALAAYLAKARAQSPSRHLFVSIPFPYAPMQSSSVTQCICKAMKQAGLPFSAYALRHTYAQNLLHMGRSIYEIKEMLGHDEIYSTQKYLYIHVDLMRKVLFHETL